MNSTIILLTIVSLLGLASLYLSRQRRRRTKVKTTDDRIPNGNAAASHTIETASTTTPAPSDHRILSQPSKLFVEPDHLHEANADIGKHIDSGDIEQSERPMEPQPAHCQTREIEFDEGARQARRDQAVMLQPTPFTQAYNEREPTAPKLSELILVNETDVKVGLHTEETVIEESLPPPYRSNSAAIQTTAAQNQKFEVVPEASVIGPPSRPQQAVPVFEAVTELAIEPQAEDHRGEETEPAPMVESNHELGPADVQIARALSSQVAELPMEEDSEQPPQRYRPPSQRAPRQGTSRPASPISERAIPSDPSLSVRIRLTFDRFAFCETSLLPERSFDLADEIDVKVGGKSLRLVAQEDWYQDLRFEKIEDHLRHGLELKGRLPNGGRVRWLLTGRDLYVLASHQRASGFLSTNRLVLGRSHVVMCSIELLQQVEIVLVEAGCQGYTRLDGSNGVPHGWVALRGVSPTKSIPLNPGADPFYAIKPAPDLEIEFEGGLCLRNSVWLAGYPPRIKLLGQANGTVKVLIDGKESQKTEEGYLFVDGYDRPQQHSVYCEGLSCSCSYSIEEPPDSWQEWRAYQFGQADICGPLVRPAAQAANKRPFSVPMSNPLLLGAEPGQIFRCSARSVAQWKGFVPFEVVWALPAYPLACDKKTARILEFESTAISPAKSHTKAVLDWCKAILDASRKGLRPSSDSAEVTARWGEYKKVARKIWRSAR